MALSSFTWPTAVPKLNNATASNIRPGAGIPQRSTAAGSAIVPTTQLPEASTKKTAGASTSSPLVPVTDISASAYQSAASAAQTTHIKLTLTTTLTRPPLPDITPENPPTPAAAFQAQLNTPKTPPLTPLAAPTLSPNTTFQLADHPRLTTPPQNSPSSSNAATIAGSSIGAILGIAVILYLVHCVKKRSTQPDVECAPVASQRIRSSRSRYGEDAAVSRHTDEHSSGRQTARYAASRTGNVAAKSDHVQNRHTNTIATTTTRTPTHPAAPIQHPTAPHRNSSGIEPAALAQAMGWLGGGHGSDFAPSDLACAMGWQDGIGGAGALKSGPEFGYLTPTPAGAGAGARVGMKSSLTAILPAQYPDFGYLTPTPVDMDAGAGVGDGVFGPVSATLPAQYRAQVQRQARYRYEARRSTVISSPHPTTSRPTNTPANFSRPGNPTHANVSQPPTPTSTPAPVPVQHPFGVQKPRYSVSPLSSAGEFPRAHRVGGEYDVSPV